MKYHAPCCFIRLHQVNLNQVYYRIRQKMSILNSLLINLNQISGMKYYLYIDIDNLMLINSTYNKIVFLLPIDQSFAICQFKINQLLEMHRLEHHPKLTIYEYNHYQSLKQQYYE